MWKEQGTEGSKRDGGSVCQESGCRESDVHGNDDDTAEETHLFCVCIPFANILLYRQLTLSLVSFSDNTRGV